ncbi:hypothetical protein [Swaminathania salitolerans]|uniref:Uncharacterized protein n=1 Tax=Swaminathania salitolerans TaxID=182838 RepID=A0A511BMT2_9PROT|nr:hypothetical protein [Swaminathania salitolerans]GBQ16060.1 hypothetical protein AA21291_2396 [Swaminathania salitolerans LMG 21291]GEL01585.1 hypothetical protein SSA02_07480 [Swaminathania salitolerans]
MLKFILFHPDKTDMRLNRSLSGALPLASATLGGFVLLLSACATPPAPSKDPRGLWTGALVTEQGTCPTESNSTLQINANDITFTPGDSALVLKGRRGPDNLHYHARLAMKDAGRKPYTIVFNGYPVGNAIGGNYGSPSCRAHVVMTRPTH